MQTEYSPFVREVETSESTDLLKTCRELGVSLVCSSPLGRGLLTGAFSTRDSVTSEMDFRGTMLPWFSKENIGINARLVEQFAAMAARKGYTASQLALAWLLAQGDDIVPIPGTKTAKNLEQNWLALKIELSVEEETEIRSFVETIELAGYRSVPAAKQLEYVDTK